MMPPTDRTEARCGLDLIARDARDDEELAGDLAIAERALDKYGKKGTEGTVSYDEYRNNRLMRSGAWDQITQLTGEINSKLDRIIDDLGLLIAGQARDVTRYEAPLVAADLGLRYTRSFSTTDLVRITGAADTSDFPADVVCSFCRALVVEATGQDGSPCYVVVEASYIINGRDTERALRSARFFAEFTARRCYAAVAGYRLDDRILQHVDSGEVFWYQLEPES